MSPNFTMSILQICKSSCSDVFNIFWYYKETKIKNHFLCKNCFCKRKINFVFSTHVSASTIALLVAIVLSLFSSFLIIKVMFFCWHCNTTSHSTTTSHEFGNRWYVVLTLLHGLCYAVWPDGEIRRNQNFPIVA